MSVRIVTDSSCDLPQTVINHYGISVIPLNIHVGTSTYRDNIELTREEFYHKLPTYRPYPQTASPAPEFFTRAFQRLAGEGAEQILSVHIARNLSGTIGAAELAANDFKAAQVTVVDSRSLTLGFGFVVQTAAELASKGQSVEQILQALAQQMKRTYVFAVLESVEYLRRSGRMNSLMAGLGSMLNVRPLLTMNDGKASSQLARTAKSAFNRVVQMTQALGNLERAALVHSNALEKAIELREALRSMLPAGEPMIVTINPALGVHVGPGGVGIACIQA